MYHGPLQHSQDKCIFQELFEQLDFLTLALGLQALVLFLHHILSLFFLMQSFAFYANCSPNSVSTLLESL